ncbi:AAA family ATPase [Candidatus Pelagibacter sp.]|jgi:predicted ATPase|nr:AAA family ATPase [Candidatus Pelagibacter sp.]
MKKISKPKKKLNDQFNRIFLSKAKIGNLKAFKGENEIQFAPMINLVFGKNSSGKSTINQSLRLFRQSYGYDKLTPFNYESPVELRGRGGLDIDVGYSGLVNNGNLNAKISLGVETGIYKNKTNEIDKNKNSINYTYKFKKNFYSGKNLVRERTILDKIHYSNAGGEALVELPKHKFFEDKSALGAAIRLGQRYHTGSFFLGQGSKSSNDDSIYKSVYHPYYYETIFKPENLEINSLEKVFFELEKVDKKIISNFYSELLKYLNKKKLSINKENKKRSDSGVGFENNYFEHRKLIRPLQKKISEIRRNCKGNNTKLINEFLKIPETIFVLYEDEFTDFDDDYKERILGINNTLKDVSKLIIFFKKPKHTKKEFINFFKKDICLRCKNIIFFNGYFMSLPKIKERNRNPYREQKGEDYLINSINFLISGDDERRRNVDILSGYQEKFSGSGGNSSMAGITKTMDKFLIAPGLRQIPKRYFVKGLQTDYVGPSAENLGELLANPEINRETNKWFQRLEIPYKVDIQKSGNYYEIIFAPKNSKIKISSMHVGLGYPLILPFIVQCIIAKNKIILIEEPEVHLHPKIEADLADLIVESSLLRNNQFIIETHSEDFLLRILKSIRQEKIKPEHVSVNYITPNDKTGSKINKITINKYGQYTTPWKDDLFADRIKELR